MVSGAGTATPPPVIAAGEAGEATLPPTGTVRTEDRRAAMAAVGATGIGAGVVAAALPAAPVVASRRGVRALAGAAAGSVRVRSTAGMPATESTTATTSAMTRV